jgi:hypothetical protein
MIAREVSQPVARGRPLKRDQASPGVEEIGSRRRREASMGAATESQATTAEGLQVLVLVLLMFRNGRSLRPAVTSSARPTTPSLSSQMNRKLLPVQVFSET